MSQTSHTQHLKFPITDDTGAEVKSITFRRPNGGDIRRANSKPGNALDVSFAIMADLAGVPIETIDKLDPTDIDAVNDWLEPILDPKARQAGSRS